MKNFGEVLRKLRRERDITQEQLAEYVNISPQSVSKWETGLTLPDITVIPMLANIFDVSADVLLGIDVSQKKKHIEKIVCDAGNLLFAGQFIEAEKLLRDALKDYPNSYSIMSMLVQTVSNIAYHDTTRQKALREEIIELCEKILEECTEDDAKQNAVLTLCQTYCSINENEKAMHLAEKMPNKSISRESLLRYILKGEVKYRHMQNIIAIDLSHMLEDIRNLDFDKLYDGFKAYNHDELIVLHHKIIGIIEILFEDGHYGCFNQLLNNTHLQLYYAYARKKDYETALKHLHLSAKHAILFDLIPQSTDVETEKYTCLLFRGLSQGFMKTILPKSSSQFVLDAIENENRCLLPPSKELDALKEELRKHVKHTTTLNP